MADEAARRAVVAERNEVNLRRNEAEYLDSCRELSASIDRLESAVVMFLGEAWQPQPAGLLLTRHRICAGKEEGVRGNVFSTTQQRVRTELRRGTRKSIG